jgi:hypothetical protein
VVPPKSVHRDVYYLVRFVLLVVMQGDLLGLDHNYDQMMLKSSQQFVFDKLFDLDEMMLFGNGSK